MPIWGYNVEEISFKRLEQVAYSPAWLKLLHYRKTLLGNYKSDADGDFFFWSSSGKIDPLQELKENLAQIDQHRIVEQKKLPYQCLFPARYQFLKKEFQLDLKSEICQELEWWLDRLAPQHISMIYSSAYPNNPASIFGHTFLKFNRNNDGRQFQDFTVDFSAVTNVSSGVIFAVKGLLGGYYGQFSTKPYYVKVNEYVYGESRDLWEYELNYSPEETKFIAFHLWELIKNTVFEYYFFDENCSYQLLTLLEVARPSVTLSKLQFFYTLPPETIKRLSSNKIIFKSSVRPSLRKQFIWKKNKLNSDQYKKYSLLVGNQLDVQEINDPKVLEVFIAFTQYKQAESEGIKEDQHLKEMLVHRAKLGGKIDFEIESLESETRNEDPLNSHGPSRVSISVGHHTQNKDFVSSEFRLGLHSFNDQQTSYPSHAHMEYGKLSVRQLIQKKKFYFDEYTLVDIMSLYPILPYDFDKSWGISVKGERPNDLASTSSISHSFQTNVGMSYSFSPKVITLFLLPGFKGEIGNSINKTFRYGPTIKAGCLFNLSRTTGLSIELNNLLDLNHNYHHHYIHSFKNTIFWGINSKSQIRLIYDIYSQSQLENRFYSEGKLAFDLYF